MPLFGEHEVWVEINGVYAKEYAVEVVDGQTLAWGCEKQVTCWIASELGKVSVHAYTHYLYGLRSY